MGSGIAITELTIVVVGFIIGMVLVFIAGRR